MKNKIVILFLYFGIINLYAQTDDILHSISEDMKYFEDVATQTKQNEHYQPYIISVFKSKDLEKVGVCNLKEALELVPGVDMATDNINIKVPIFRGSNPLAYGQTKLFIDGVFVNNLFFDAYSEYLSMPIEMIKRVEVIRGPGSKTDGVNAYAGSINVVTYAEQFKGFKSNDKLVFKYGSYDYKMAGFVKNFKVDDFKTSIDFSYQSDDKKIDSGYDALSQGIFGAINAPLSKSGDAPIWMESYSLGLNISYKDFYLKGRFLYYTQGSAYGINYALPLEDDRVKLPNYSTELGYKKEIEDFIIDIKAGIKYDAFDSKSKLAPDGLILPSQDGIVLFEDGIYGEHSSKQRTINGSFFIKYNAINSHKITAGYRQIQEMTIDTSTKLSNRLTGDVDLVDYTDTLPFFDKNAKRDIYIFSLQDEYNINPQLTLLYGFIYESTTYQDAGFEPSISMVYQLDTNNIFKALYSRAHRNPSWQEMFTMNNLERVGNTDLKPEKVDAFELAYIKKFSTVSYMQTNIFYLLNKDQIYNSYESPLYINAVDTNLYGIEFEYKGNILPTDQIYLNYSYVDGYLVTKNVNEHEDLSNIANHLAKAYYTYNLNTSLSFSLLGKYVGSKNRATGDIRKKLDAYSTLDTSIQYTDNRYDYKILLSAKNIFDAKVKYPSQQNTYSQDYVQEGRNFLITLKKRF
jgi:iron complex outermembrane receptor protein